MDKQHFLTQRAPGTQQVLRRIEGLFLNWVTVLFAILFVALVIGGTQIRFTHEVPLQVEVRPDQSAWLTSQHPQLQAQEQIKVRHQGQEIMFVATEDADAGGWKAIGVASENEPGTFQMTAEVEYSLLGALFSGIF